MKKAIFIISVILLSSCTNNNYNIKHTAGNNRFIQAKVLYIIDGDTIKIETLNNEIINFNDFYSISPHTTNSVRFLFIDTPESFDNPRLERILIKKRKEEKYVRKEDIIALGIMAKNHLKDILKPEDTVFIEFPIEDIKDKYNRFLGLVYINNTNLSYLQVKDGFASTYFLNNENSQIIKYYKKIFKEAESLAKKHQLGIWKYSSEE